jgi:hypothetical protein
MALFKELHDGTLPLSHLNYDIITLLPKLKEATHINTIQINLFILNVSFKSFHKGGGDKASPY